MPVTEYVCIWYACTYVCINVCKNMHVHVRVCTCIKVIMYRYVHHSFFVHVSGKMFYEFMHAYMYIHMSACFYIRECESFFAPARMCEGEFTYVFDVCVKVKTLCRFIMLTYYMRICLYTRVCEFLFFYFTFVLCQVRIQIERMLERESCVSKSILSLMQTINE